MKILVIKFMHIGDVLLITPLLRNLKHHFPNARIDVALNKGTEEMVTENPSVGKIHIYDRPRIKKLSLIQRLKEEYKFARTIRDEKYDIVINLTQGDRGITLAALSGSKQIYSYPSNKHSYLNRFIVKQIPKPPQKHWVDKNLSVLHILEGKPIKKNVEIFWSKETEQKISNLLQSYNIDSGNFIHLHPVSRWFFKCIDDQITAKIIDHCQQILELPIIITAAPDDNEQKKIKTILSQCKTHPIDLSGKLSLKETAALNKKSRLYIGVDTAIMHISAANNTPTLALFGPSIPYAWGPWDNNIYQSGYDCLRGNQSMGKHRILQKRWECVPCDAKGCNNSGVSDCLMQMDLKEITDTIDEMLKEVQ